MHATIGQPDAPDFLAGIRLPRQCRGAIGMRFVPVVVAYGGILRSRVTGWDRQAALNCRIGESARRYNAAVTAQQALNTALNTDPGERRRRHETMCGSRGSCRPETLENDPGRWTFCPDCLTLYDDLGKTVNPIRTSTRESDG
jgi:hypothetical protein